MILAVVNAIKRPEKKNQDLFQDLFHILKHLHLSHFLKLFDSQNRRVHYLMLLEWERQLRSLFTKFHRDSKKRIIKYILGLIYTYIE